MPDVVDDEGAASQCQLNDAEQRPY